MLAHDLTWERTVNAVGRLGKNIPKDLYCEHTNKEAKGKLMHLSIIHIRGKQNYLAATNCKHFSTFSTCPGKKMSL